MNVVASCAAPAGTTSLRRVSIAPGSRNSPTVDLLTTSNHASLLHWQFEKNASQLHLASPQSIPLVSPARDVTWNPRTNERASFLCACRSQPLQLYQCNESGSMEQRASFPTINQSGILCDPTAVQWTSGATSTGLAAAGYGGFEDAVAVRVFDVETQAEVWEFTPAHRKRGRAHSVAGGAGRISVLCAAEDGPTLLYAGYYDKRHVDVLDMRSHCAAAKLDLRQLSTSSASSGCMSVCTHPGSPYLIYAGGRSGADQILGWDIRRPLEPLSMLHRPVHSNQRCEMAVLPSSSARGGYVLCAASPTGGIHVFPCDPSASVGVEKDATVGREAETEPGELLLPELGTTYGLRGHASLLAVTGGLQRYETRGFRRGGQPGASAAVSSALTNPDEEAEESAPIFPSRVHTLSPCSSESDSEHEHHRPTPDAALYMVTV